MNPVLLATAGAALGGSALLTAAGLSHLRGLATFRHMVRAHRILPVAFAPVVAVALPVTELTIGMSAIAAVAAGAQWTVLTFAAQCLLYLAFAGYSWRLLRTDRQVSCGCFGTGEPVSSTTVTRAFFFALASGVTAAGPSGIPTAWISVVWLTALATSLAGWLLPAVLTPAKAGTP